MAMKFRSAEWFYGRDELGFQHRAALRSLGIEVERFRDRPVVGIANSWSELNNCDMNLRSVAEAVKRGVIAAGGLPLEFPTISLGEEFMKPTAMLYRNLMAMDVEETLRSNPIDAVVLLCNCDKTVPAQLMGAASANLPAIQLNGGPKPSGSWHGIEVGSGTDMWKYWDEYRLGKITDKDWQELEGCISCGVGACNVMGTASTMAGLSEALGMMLPGSSSICATDARRMQAAEASGRRIVEMAEQGLRPSDIMTEDAFENAIRVCMAIGGSTNAIIHLVAIAGRLGINLPLTRFDELSRTTPWLANVKPSGKFLMAEFHAAGGIPAVMQEISPLLRTQVLTVTGKTVSENLVGSVCHNYDVIRPASAPIAQEGAMAVLRGNLAPNGAILKTSAASDHLKTHTGRAVVFENYQDMLSRIEDPDLKVTATSVLVLKNAGPKGVPGMPEWGSIPIPAKLQRAGIKDLVRISDARMSGTSYGTVVLHVCPEAATGGLLAIVRTGDHIRLDVPRRALDLLVPEDEIQQRLACFRPPESEHLRGYPRLYIDHVLQADQGCDFDFLRPKSAAEQRFVAPVVGRS
jgi:dihydroxy-acid dehydratase